MAAQHTTDRRRTVTGIGAAAALCTLTLAACGQQAGGTPPVDAPAADREPLESPRFELADNALQALFEGQLGIDEDNCVYGEAEDGTRLLIGLPEETTTVPSEDALDMRAGPGGEVPLGQPVSLGGGFFDFDDPESPCDYHEVFHIHSW